MMSLRSNTKPVTYFRSVLYAEFTNNGLMRKEALVMAVLFLSGFASGFPVQMDVVDRKASIDDPAVFNLTVENEQSVQDRFRISSISSPPVASNWFEYDYIKTVEEESSETFRIRITPERNSIQQNYEFTVNVRAFNRDELEKITDFFTVSNPYDLQITSFQVSDQQLDPGDKLEVSATVRNTASTELKNFTVEASSFNQTVQKDGATLESGDSIRYNFEIPTSRYERPGERKVSVSVYKDGKKSRSSSQQISIREVRETEMMEDTENRFLAKKKTVKVRNSGNTEALETVKQSLPVYLDPLTQFEPEPDEVSGEGSRQIYSWNVETEPGEQKQISYKISYLPAAGFIFMLFLGILGFKKLQTDLKFSKQARYSAGSLKVRIELENNSSNELTDLKVKDFVPDIAEVSREFEMASPRVTKTNSGTRLEWNIESLQPGEKRVFEYGLKPLVEVEDGVNLGPAEIIRKGEKLKETSRIETEFIPE